jgi:hypothetical protein
MRIQGPIYISRISSASLTTALQTERESVTLSENFASMMEAGNWDYVFAWDTDYVDNYAQKHVEKWVERVGLHFHLYSSRRAGPMLLGGQAPQGVQTPTATKAVLKLTQKVFSGDVSGSIGEALLAVLLRLRYGLQSTDFLHLRATKQSGKAPDFYIKRITPRLAQDLDPVNAAKVNAPLVAEVKGATSFTTSVISAKITDALSQVQALRALNCYGLASVFLRDPVNQQYHGFMVVVRPEDEA